MIVGELNSTHLRRKVKVSPVGVRRQPVYPDDAHPIENNPLVVLVVGTLMRILHEEGTHDEEDLVSTLSFFDTGSLYDLRPDTPVELVAEDTPSQFLTQDLM